MQCVLNVFFGQKFKQEFFTEFESYHIIPCDIISALYNRLLRLFVAYNLRVEVEDKIDKV